MEGIQKRELKVARVTPQSKERVAPGFADYFRSPDSSFANQPSSDTYKP